MPLFGVLKHPVLSPSFFSYLGLQISKKSSPPPTERGLFILPVKRGGQREGSLLFLIFIVLSPIPPAALFFFLAGIASFQKKSIPHSPFPFLLPLPRIHSFPFLPFPFSPHESSPHFTRRRPSFVWDSWACTLQNILCWRIESETGIKKSPFATALWYYEAYSFLRP